jgi:predicted ATPase with chaperone activity
MEDWQALIRRGKVVQPTATTPPAAPPAPEPAAVEPERPMPPVPRSLQDTGLSESYITDLVLKTLHVRGNLMGVDLCDEIRLPYPAIVQNILTFLKDERLVEILGGEGLTELTWNFRLTERGAEVAREAMRRDSYVGPAPVSLDTYVEWAGKQKAEWTNLRETDIRSAVAHLVISDATIEQVGPAFTSGKPLLIYGHAGNGKTVLAEALATCLPDDIFIPFAIEAGSQTIRLYDAAQHRRAEESTADARRRDARFLRIRRPFIVVGGELTFEQVGLAFDPTVRCYVAPVQMKANGGILLIDDFGRQQVSPKDLLNRWIIPMEKAVDYHTLATGAQVRVPFNVMLVFSTNLSPSDLVDEAFLRRIRYKMYMNDPTEEQFRAIFDRVCQARGIAMDDAMLDYLIEKHYRAKSRPFRASQPRDLLDLLSDIAHFRGLEPELTEELLGKACASYFVD